MNASDIMTDKVVTAHPDDTVLSIVDKMLDHRISAVPVIDEEGRVVGIVSEGDLLSRPETSTARRPSWWLSLFAAPDEQARAFLKSHGTRASDIMTRKVVTATEDESAADIARKLEQHHVKRVPIVRDGKLVGIVSRANLLRSFASGMGSDTADRESGTIRDTILSRLESAGIATHLLSVTVTDDTVELWGMAESSQQVTAVRAAAEGAAPSRTVVNNLSVRDFPMGL